MKRLTPVWIFVVVFAACAVYLPGLSKYLALKRKEEQLDQQIAQLKAQIDALKSEDNLLRTDLGHLEQVVRRELGLVKPGEIVYKVVERNIPEKKNAPSSSESR